MSLQGVLLTLLSNQPDSGYGLSRRLRKELSHVWEARLQQVYVELAKLEAHGLVEARRVRQRNRPAKKLFSLTQAGERALDAWLASETPPITHRDERLARLAGLHRMPAHVLMQHLETWLEGWRREAETLERRISLVSRTDPAELGRLLALEATLARARCDIAWCERVHRVASRTFKAKARALTA